MDILFDLSNITALNLNEIHLLQLYSKLNGVYEIS